MTYRPIPEGAAPTAGGRAPRPKSPLRRRQLGDLRIIIRAVEADRPSLSPGPPHLEFEALAARRADIGRELHRVRHAVGLRLDVAPVDLIGGDVDRHEPVRASGPWRRSHSSSDRPTSAPNGMMMSFGFDKAGPPGERIDDRRAETGREGRIGGERLARLEVALAFHDGFDPFALMPSTAGRA
jgi:hypothetical protein